MSITKDWDFGGQNNILRFKINGDIHNLKKSNVDKAITRLRYLLDQVKSGNRQIIGIYPNFRDTLKQTKTIKYSYCTRNLEMDFFEITGDCSSITTLHKILDVEILLWRKIQHHN